jgi:hypothetical protein
MVNSAINVLEVDIEVKITLKKIIKVFIPYGLLWVWANYSYIFKNGKKKRRRQLRFDVHLVDHCNLSCKGCEHFSSIADNKFLSLGEFERDCKRLSELTGGIVDDIALLGGEPLLHPQITDFCFTARKYFHTGMIYIITNGVLLEKQDAVFWDTLKENNITLIISVYPVKINHGYIQKLAAKYGIEIVYWGDWEEMYKRWRKMPIDVSGGQDPKKSYTRCYAANGCFQLVDGKIFPCFRAAYVGYFNKQFNQSLTVTEKDYIDIYKVKNSNEILNFLRGYVPFCRYCNMNNIKETQWAVTKKKIEEWI